MKHAIWMLIGCVLPLLLVFILPYFGVSGTTSILLFGVLMLGCHLMMMFGHGDHDDHSKHSGHEKKEN